MNPICDRFNRRDFLRLGSLGLTLGWPTLGGLRAQSPSGESPSRSGESLLKASSRYKSIINIHLEGGPPQMDTFDMKPDGLAELRGEFQPIRTNVPGIEICSLLPRLARLADKYTIIRSVYGNVDAHNFDTTQLGYPGLKMKSAAMRPVGGAPAVGSVITKLLGSQSGAPAFVWDCMGGSQAGVQTGYLGPAYKPFTPQSSGSTFKSRLPAARLHERSSLLQGLDTLRRDLDTTGEWEAMDAFNRQAVEVVLSGRLGEALDLRREDPRVRERYKAGAGRYSKHTERFLLARRLVEAGVRYVALNWGGYLGFDSHEENYPKMRAILPPTDAGLSALISDLVERGLDRDVLVVIWGEFGRTPKINAKGGRDHWPAVQSALVVGGGLRMGQVIGSTDRAAAEPASRPVHVHEILSTMYRHLGIDATKTQLIDPTGRPRYLLDVREPIRELTG